MTILAIKTSRLVEWTFSWQTANTDWNYVKITRQLNEKTHPD
jgi:hypothetical protein